MHRPAALSGDLARTAFRSGSIAAIAMIPPGLAFYLLGLRVNEYGMAVVQALFGGFPPVARVGLFALEHVLISWTASVPLLLALVLARGRLPEPVLGLAYGLGFYVVVNSLALPWIFADPTPWQLGPEVVLPSLVVHLVYGLVVALAARDFVARHSGSADRAPPTQPTAGTAGPF